MRNIHLDVYLGLGLLFGAGYFYTLTGQMPPGPALFPKLLLVILMAFSCAICTSGVRATLKARRANALVKKHFARIKEPAVLFIAICFYVGLVDFLGFFAASSLASVFFMIFFGLRNPIRILLVLIGLNAFIYGLFVWQLKIGLPTGILI